MSTRLAYKAREATRLSCRRCAVELCDENARRVTWRPGKTFVGLCRACEYLRVKERRAQ